MSDRCISPMSTDSFSARSSIFSEKPHNQPQSKRDLFRGLVDDTLVSEGDQLLLTATRVLATAFHNGFLQNTPGEFENITTKCACIADRLREGVTKTLQPTGAQTAFNPVIRQLTSEQNAYELMSVVLEYEALARRTDSVLGELLSENSDFKMLSVLLEWSERCGHRFLEGFSKHAFDARLFRNVYSLRQETLSMMKNNELDQYGRVLGVTADSNACEGDLQLIEHFYKTLFSLVRCGRLDEAEALCDQVGESIWGGLLTTRMVNKNPEYTPKDIQKSNSMWRNRRKVFKQFVNNSWEKMNAMHIPLAQRFLFATLAGQHYPLMDSASTSEDRIWCLANAAVEHMLDVKMKSNIDETTSLEGVPITIDQLEKCINLKNDPSPYMHIYFYLLRNKILECVGYMANWVEKHESRAGDHIIRFMSNLVIIWKQESVPHEAEKSDIILKEYVRRLQQIDMPTLIPFYLSFCSNPETMFEQLMVAMDAIVDESERREFLGNAHESKISVPELLLNYVFFKINYIGHKDLDEIRQEECKQVINAWRWMLLVGDEALVGTLYATNALIRTLLRLDQEDLAGDVLQLALEAGECATLTERIENLGIHEQMVKQAIEEYNNHSVYLASVKLWIDWNMERNRVLQSDAAIRFHHATHAATTSLGLTVNKLSELRRKDSALLRESVRLESIQQEAVRISFDFLRNNGWRDSEIIESDHSIIQRNQEARVEELSQLRSLYYASTCVLLCSAFEQTYESSGAIELARLLADEKYEIYKDIEKNTMKELLKKLQRLTGNSFTVAK